MKRFQACLVLILAQIWQNSAAIIYVDGSNHGGASVNGTSWSQAYDNLDIATNKASSGDEIYIRQGTYYPQMAFSGGSSRDYVFQITKTLSLYGGFFGNETSKTQRSYPLQRTIISGDISNTTSIADNVYHLFSLRSVGPTVKLVLDGFQLEFGSATSYNNTDASAYGGAIYVWGSNLTINDCVFENNYANNGGAIFSHESYVTITSSTFRYNYAYDGNFNGGYGGAIHAVVGGRLYIYNSIFEYNSAIFRGGAIYIDYAASLTMENTTMSYNSATNGHGGAIFQENRSSQDGKTYISLRNNTFYYNNATNGDAGALFIYNDAVIEKFDYNNFTSNLASNKGGAVVYYLNATFSESSFVNYYTNNTALNISSTNDIYVLDLNYNFGDFNSIDVDYYLNLMYNDYNVSIEPSQRSIIYYVNGQTGSDSNNGKSWANAFKNIQTAIDTVANSQNKSNTEIWVAQGSYSATYNLKNSTAIQFVQYYTFLLKSYVCLFGGFYGNETSRSQRNFYKYKTILNGTLGPFKALHVLITQPNSLIDGFVITNGYGALTQSVISNATSGGSGGGGGGGNNGPPQRRLLASSIEEISSSFYEASGGGILNNQSNTIYVNLLVYDNYAGKGSGLYCVGNSNGYESSSAPTLINVYFVDNVAGERGGGISNDLYCELTCIKCSFYNNVVGIKGGAIYNDWGVTIHLYYNTLVNNVAYYESGGGIAADGVGTTYVYYTNINNNTAFSEGGGVYLGTYNADLDELQKLYCWYCTLNNNVVSNGHSTIFAWQSDVVQYYSSYINNNSSLQNYGPLNGNAISIPYPNYTSLIDSTSTSTSTTPSPSSSANNSNIIYTLSSKIIISVLILITTLQQLL